MTGDERLKRLLGGPDHARLRQRLRRLFERAGGATDNPSTFRLGGLVAEEVALLASLMGRPVRQDATSISVDLDTIDTALRRAGLANSLKDALEQLDGPIIRRAEVVAAATLGWSRLVRDLQDARLVAWLSTPNGLGLLKRLTRQDIDVAAELCGRAERVLGVLPAAGRPRAEIAARVLGDAHALDAGVPTATVVLAALRHGDRIIAIRDDLPSDGVPDADMTASDRPASALAESSGDSERDRHIWARVGVLVNELARPALVLNLPLAEGGVWGGCPGEPSHMTLRALVRSPPRFDVAGKTISVCENPNVVALVADHLGANAAPLVSIEGMPAAAQRTLLLVLTGAGARLRYHGDFDWAGLRIAATVMAICGATPWRFTGEDYNRSIQRLIGAPLLGMPAPSPWDTSLSNMMKAHGRSIAEEATIDDLLEDLRC